MSFHLRSLRRRFEQNQEDCTFTVLALLPTATSNIVEAMNTESITYEIQQLKSVAKHGPKSVSGDSTAAPSIADTALTEEESRSMVSLQSESGIHASQIVTPSPLATTSDEGKTDGATQAQTRKTKRQLWDQLTISGMLPQSATKAAFMLTRRATS
jgi:peroxin-3